MTERARRVARLWLALVGVAYAVVLLWVFSGVGLLSYAWDQVQWAGIWLLLLIPWSTGWLCFPGMWILGEIRSRGGGRLLWRWWAGGLLTSVAFGTGTVLYLTLFTLTWLESWVLAPYLLVPLAGFPAIWVLTTKPRDA